MLTNRNRKFTVLFGGVYTHALVSNALKSIPLCGASFRAMLPAGLHSKRSATASASIAL